jgi:hypothetical protein
MITIVLGVALSLAALAFAAAVIAAFQIVALAPKGQKLATYGQLGWWQFDKIRATVGPAGDLPLRTYQRAFVVFMVIVVLAAIGGTLLGAQAQN